MFTRGFFMVGYPWETLDDLQEVSRNISKLALDDIRITIYTPLPGTRLYDECSEKGIINNNDWSAYDVETSVIQKIVLDSDLMEMRNTIFSNFYNSNEYERRCEEHVKRYPSYRITYDELLNNLQEKGVV